MKTALLGKTLDELNDAVKELGMPAFSARQIAQWLYGKKVSSIDEMTNLSLRNRELLKEHYEVGAALPVHAMRSADGTVKYLSVLRKATLWSLFISLTESVRHCAFLHRSGVK